MSPELFVLLGETTLAGSAAILLLLALRQPLRALFGATTAYAAWGLLPAALVAVALPAALAPVVSLPVEAAVAQATTMVVAAPVVDFDFRPLLLGLWGVGAVGMAGWLLRQQQRFLDGLGVLLPRGDGLLQSEAVAGLPAVIGWPARIVLPGDFEQRYDLRQQELVLCHEQVHQQRGDLVVNALVSLLRCVFWFNPIMHVAADRFRQDQELACDATVLRQFPGMRRSYGDALLKTQLADRPLPVGCHWFGSHPLKERIAMLKHPLPSKSRWFTGLALVAVFTVAGGWTAWAAQPARTPSAIATTAASVPGVVEGELAMTLKVSFDGQGEQVESLNVRAGELRTFDFEQDGQAWRIALTLTPQDDGTIYVAADIHRDGVSQGQPKLVFKPAPQSAAIRIGEEKDGKFTGVAIELTVALPSVAGAETLGGLPADPARAWKFDVARLSGATQAQPAAEC